MNVVIYARFSSHNQSETSIEGQLAVCKDYAKKNDYTVIGEYIDRATTGTNDNRPQFQQMIEDCSKKQFKGVLVYQLDRFARNRYDSANYKAKLKKNDVRVLSAKENISEDASGILMESVLEGMAEYYSVELGQKVKRGMKINAEKCYYNGGTVPLGLKLEEAERINRLNNKPIIKWKYAIDEDTAPIIRKVFDMYIDGYLMADIIRYLNKQQLKTAYGKEFNKNSIRRLITNKKYIGVYTYGGKEVENGIPSIITNEIFSKAQNMINVKKLAPAKARAKKEYLLTTKLFCGHCKDMMTGTSGTSGTGKLHSYYLCNTAKKRLNCNKKSVQKDYVEDLVVNKAREILADNKNIKMIAKEVMSVVEKEKDNTNIKRLNKLLNENIKKQENLVKAVTECDIETVRKTLYQELSSIDTIIKDIEKQIAIEETQYVRLEEDEILFFLEKLRDGNINDIKYRKMLINVLIYKVYLYDESITIVFTLKGKQVEAKIPTIDVIESSLNGTSALPNC